MDGMPWVSDDAESMARDNGWYLSSTPTGQEPQPRVMMFSFEGDVLSKRWYVGFMPPSPLD